MVKVVVDANVLISAAFGGHPLDAVREALEHGRVFVSDDIEAEIETTIRRLSAKLGEERTRALLGLWKNVLARCERVAPKRKLAVCRDPKDDAYLSLCAEVEADYLVTGDRDLLEIDTVRGIGEIRGLAIVTPRQFLDVPRA